MPNPKAIDVPKLGFSDAQTDVLNIMMNKEEWDYSTVDEIAHMEELSGYSYEAICTAVYGLKKRNSVYLTCQDDTPEGLSL